MEPRLKERICSQRESVHSRSGRSWALIIWPHHTKGVKNDTSRSRADARIKGVVIERNSKGGKYLLKILLCRRITCELMLSVSL